MKNENIKKNKSALLWIGVAAAIAIVVLLNIFVTMLSDMLPLKIDLTPNKIYELSEKTEEFLKTYNTPTTIYILASEADQDDRISSVLNKYAALNKNISVKNINMRENPTFGKGYADGGETLSSNSVIVGSGSRHKIFTQTQLHERDSGSGDYLNVENNITAALKYVSGDTVLMACFTSGHGEASLKGAANKLTDENYEVKEIVTLTEDIPSESSVIFIVNPSSDFSQDEIKKLDDYLIQGGNLQVYFNVADTNLPNLTKYLEGWGISVNNDVVLENNSDRIIPLGSSTSSLTVPNLTADTEYTHDLIEKKRTLAYISNSSKSLTILFEENGAISVTPLLVTSENAYVSTNYENVTDGISGEEGMYTVSALAEDAEHNSSIYVSGNTFLLQNDESVLSGEFSLANYDYFINLLNYTSDNGDNFTVASKRLLEGNITVSKSASNIIMAVVIIVIPLLVLLIGVVIWIRRRNL